MQHLDEGTIHAWLDGALPPLDAEQVAKHAVECATCAAAVAEARGIIAGSARIVSALDDVPSRVIPSGGRATSPVAGTSLWRRLRLTPGRAALAATILLAVSATLTLRSPSTPTMRQGDSAVGIAVSKPLQTLPAAAPRAVIVDSIRVAEHSSQVVNASVPRRSGAVAKTAQPQTVAERNEIADVGAPRDTSPRDAPKIRAAAQAVVAGGSAVAAPPAEPSMKANSAGAERSLAVRDSASTFEGCYRLTADSASGSTEMPRGLPATFALSRPPAMARATAQSLATPRRADLRADSSAVVTVWQQLSTTQANVTFGAGSARQVSLTLTAGSPVGVASSGDRMTRVRVMRSSCPP